MRDKVLWVLRTRPALKKRFKAKCARLGQSMSERLEALVEKDVKERN